MNGKRFADIMVCSLAAAVMILGYLYIDSGRSAVCGAACAFFLLFLILAVADTEKSGRQRKAHGKKCGSRGSFHALVLLDEEGAAVSEWNIAGKVSVLIGRDTRREDVDVNLANSAFGGTVDRQHAVMNYTAGQWYIEDLNSTNGIRIQKKDGRLYEVSRTQPCLVEKGDILFIGLTKLTAK